MANTFVGAMEEKPQKSAYLGNALKGDGGTGGRKLALHITLFVLTILSTTLIQGFAYSFTLIFILLLHEMGHYFAARYYRVSATLPYFLPFPNLFGTVGAVIKMEGRIPNRKALFDIGIMGPALGVVIALPATVLGIYLSEVVQVESLSKDTLELGNSVLFGFISWLIHGELAEGYDLLLHPIGFAGWAGLFVTALNLLPMGQLDGGHIIYALLPKTSNHIYRGIFVLFFVVALLVNPTWLFFLLFIFFLIRLNHPPTMDDSQPIGRKRQVFGILALLFFLLTFPPVPLAMK